MNARNQKGFTIIETLVAITILMIAIAGPLTVANKGYTAAFDARNQAIANNLAQEDLEYLNNMKDNWIAGGYSGWPTGWPGNVPTCQANSYPYCDYSNWIFTVHHNLVSVGSGNPTDQYTATVIVSWNNASGGINSVQLQELLTNATR